MTKKFLKDNRGQVLYAVIVVVMFMVLLSMIAMGLTFKNYNASLHKQQHVADYYAADAIAELIRIGEIKFEDETEKMVVDLDTFKPVAESDQELVRKATVTKDVNENTYTIVTDTATLKVTIVDRKFTGWEVSYHAVETQAEDAQPQAE